MIYHAICEIQYRLSKHPDEKRFLVLWKNSLMVKKIAESTYWERLRTLEIEVEIVNKPPKKGILSFCRKVILIPVLILVIYRTINSLAAPPHTLKIYGMIYASLVKTLRLWIK